MRNYFTFMCFIWDCKCVCVAVENTLLLYFWATVYLGFMNPSADIKKNGKFNKYISKKCIYLYIYLRTRVEWQEIE